MPHSTTAPRKMTPYDLTGRTAIVTGSSTGNGRAIAIALAEAGADSMSTSSQLPLPCRLAC